MYMTCGIRSVPKFRHTVHPWWCTLFGLYVVHLQSIFKFIFHHLIIWLFLQYQWSNPGGVTNHKTWLRNKWITTNLCNLDDVTLPCGLFIGEPLGYDIWHFMSQISSFTRPGQGHLCALISTRTSEGTMLTLIGIKTKLLPDAQLDLLLFNRLRWPWKGESKVTHCWL